MKKFKQIVDKIRITVKLLISIVMNMSITYSDTIIRLLPKNVSDNIKSEIRNLLSRNIPGVEKQKIVALWIMSELIVKLDEDLFIVKYYNALPNDSKKAIIMSVVSSIFEIMTIENDL